MKGKNIIYTQAQRDFVKDNCTLPIAELYQAFCQAFDRHDISQFNLNALRKRNGWKTGRTGRYEKGNIPHPNSGPKGPNTTSFKLGHAPANIKQLYTERFTKDFYIEIKVPEKNPYTGAKTRYRLKHQWVWEQHNPPVPDGHTLRFIDGDRQNCDLSNLEVIPRGLAAILNKKQHSSLPAEIKPVVRTLAELQYKQGQLEREQQND